MKEPKVKAVRSNEGRALIKQLAEPLVRQMAPDEISSFDEIAEAYLDDPRISSDEPLASGLGLLPDIVIVLSFVATTLDRLLRRGVSPSDLSSLLGKADTAAARAASPSRAQPLESGVVEQALTGAIDSLAQASRESGWSRERLESLYQLLRARLVDREKLSILFLGASPDDAGPLRIDRELREVQDALRGTPFGERISLQPYLATRIDDLQRALLDHRPRILHFGGHGSPAAAILLEGNDGLARPLTARSLALLFGNFSATLFCVVLNACYSASQAYAIAQSVDFVIGMSDKISDAAATGFSRSFYRALASGESLSRAVALGRSQIDLDGSSSEASMPVLIAPRSDPANAYLLARP